MEILLLYAGKKAFRNWPFGDVLTLFGSGGGCITSKMTQTCLKVVNLHIFDMRKWNFEQVKLLTKKKQQDWLTTSSTKLQNAIKYSFTGRFGWNLECNILGTMPQKMSMHILM